MGPLRINVESSMRVRESVCTVSLCSAGPCSGTALSPIQWTRVAAMGVGTSSSKGSILWERWIVLRQFCWCDKEGCPRTPCSSSSNVVADSFNDRVQSVDNTPFLTVGYMMNAHSALCCELPFPNRAIFARWQWAITNDGAKPLMVSWQQ